MSKSLNNRIILITISLMFIGLAAIYSATRQSYLEGANLIFYRQIIWVAIGIITLFVASSLNYRRFYEIAYLFYPLSIILLVIVIVLGREIYGAQRWLELGWFNFQPSEFSKLAVILFLSRYFSQNKNYPGKLGRIWHGLIVPLFFVTIPMGLVFLQPDLGTATLIFLIFLAIIFVSGIELKHILIFLALIAASLPFMWHFLKDYQKDRLLVFLNPNVDPLGAGYTIIQSKIAIGSGMLLGKGWLSGTQNQLNFLPERHTDFIFSVIGEEWGFWGGAVLITLYFLLLNEAIQIASHSKDKFASLLATGAISLIAFQAIINISMALGIFPVVGLSLPFISYGGSSLVIFCFLTGVLLSINKRRIIF